MKPFFYILFLGLTFSCSLDKEQQRHSNIIKPKLPAQIADSVNVTYSEQGVIKFKLSAPKLIMKDSNVETYNEFPDGLHLTFFKEDGTKNAELFADYGYDNQRKRLRYVKDSVKIITSKGEIFTTSELYINEAKDSVYNNGKYVKITKPNGTIIQGYGFISDTRLEKIRISKITDSRYVLEEDQQAEQKTEETP